MSLIDKLQGLPACWTDLERPKIKFINFGHWPNMGAQISCSNQPKQIPDHISPKFWGEGEGGG